MAPLRGESHFCLIHRDFKVMETYSGNKCFKTSFPIAIAVLCRTSLRKLLTAV